VNVQSARVVKVRSARTVLHVNKMLVLPQPFGAAILARTAAGNESILDSRVKTLVIDPGYFTFDWLMLDGGQPVLESSGSFEGGVSQLLNSVAAKVRADHGSNLTLDGVETGLRLGEANFGYKRIDMKPYRQQMRAAADQVVSEFLGYLTIQRAGVQRIFLAGGGAHEYLPSLQARLPEFDIKISESPIMDNARGFYAFGAHTLKSMANG
ncbi:MAG TPA: ParM/StbA family protein, partial [Burkholderiaceae bacterium]|nr:ParM/StbA family protein [Burkholderiaceae bacterium]